MKKIASFILLTLFTKFSFAQTDMITALKAIGEDVVYTEYLFVTITPGKKNEITEKRYKGNIKLEKNGYGKIVGFNALGLSEGKMEGIKYNHMNNKFDNYTHPSYMASGDSWAYTIINGVIFDLEHFENTTSFVIRQVWLPKIPKEKANDAIFQGGKMTDLESADLMKLVKDYFVAMKKIQEASPYTESEQKEADAMKFTVDSTNIMGRQSNADYWNSEAGKKKLGEMRKSPVSIYNDTKTDFLICHGQGVSTFLKPGEKKEFSCNGGGKVYKGERIPNNTTNLKSTNILLLDLNGTNCGTTFNASSFK